VLFLSERPADFRAEEAGSMITELDELVRSISDSGLMTEKEVNAFIDGLPADRRPGDAQQLVQELVRHKRLTKFQAQAVYQGKARSLVMGNYVLCDKLGEGGMGQVFKAQHRRMDRLVALKVLPAAAMKSEEAVQRFHREVKAAARLSHPNIVRAYDADESRGLHFLVMEYVEGTDLASLVQSKGPLPADLAIDYLLQAAKGLEYAHSQKIIHRDIKPSNLFLDETGVVKILDMGLARIEETPDWSDKTADGALTRDGAVMGTVDYMSPEQGLNTKNADVRSDIYSLGCTLYWLLVGKPMYEGDSLMEKLLAHREKPIPSLLQVRKDIPASLDALFRKMVSKQPERRHQDMSGVVADLEKCARHAGRTAMVRPVVNPAAFAETVQLPGPTTPAPTATASAPLPPAAVRPTSPESRRQEARTAAKKHQQQKQRTTAMREAIHDADRDYRRRHGLRAIDKVLAVFRKAGNMGIKLVVLAVVIGGGYWGVSIWWRNSSLIARCQEQVVEVVNQRLRQAEMEDIDSVDFANVSTLRSVPDILSFQTQLFQTTNVGRRPVANLTGRFDRVQGLVELNIDWLTGIDQQGIMLRGKPVE
jgi:serine/threonine protein kinase